MQKDETHECAKYVRCSGHAGSGRLVRAKPEDAVEPQNHMPHVGPTVLEVPCEILLKVS